MKLNLLNLIKVLAFKKNYLNFKIQIMISVNYFPVKTGLNNIYYSYKKYILNC